ncbi:MAG: efflux RND transporter periplasmic adaptor subunit [Acidobacteria bacterium]|nr:MAG: efflux RND transporter periplasmic adaptor subunit [Acidobacteriota bacterium]
MSVTSPRGFAGAAPAALAILLLAALLGAAGCSSRGDARPEGSDQAEEIRADRPGAEADADGSGDEDEDVERIPVEVVALETGPIEELIRASANIEAEASVEVYAKAGGVIEELRVEEGDEVREGDLLARLEDHEQRNRLARVEAELAKARREYERQQRLHAEQLISDQAFNDATFEVRQLEIQLDDARRQFEYTRVRAPISGRVTARLINRGELVRVNQHLFDIVDFDSLVARIYVPERQLARISVGQPARVRVDALGGRSYRGRVIRVSPVVDPKTGTVKVTIGLGGQPGLRPGLFVSVELIVGTDDDALLVPKRALVYDGEQALVYRVDPDALVARRVLLEPVMENREFVKPARGLEPGDLVVVAGQAGLDDGTPVEILDPDAPAADDAESAAEPAAGGGDAS